MGNQLARRLIKLHERFQLKENTPTAIFGTIGTLQQNIQTREQYRIGVWPCICTESPALGVGLMTTFAYLLDSLNDVRAYMLFLREDKAQPSFSWSDAQFGIEDWQPEQLNENIGIAAKLSQDSAGWTWEIEVENDLVAEDHADSEFKLTYQMPDLATLFNQLTDIATTFLKRLGLENVRFDTFSPTHSSDGAIISVMKPLADWQINLTRGLIGLDRLDESIEYDIHEIAQAGNFLQDSFSAWIASTAIAHALLPGYGYYNALRDELATAIQTLNDFPFAVVYIGSALFLLGEANASYEMLEGAVNDHPQSVIAWLTLADFYRRGAKLTEMIDTFQRAIEVDAVDATLYRNYGTVLELLNDGNLLPEVILIDPQDYDEMLHIWEAIAAYDEALKLQPKSLTVLQRRTMLLLDVSDDDEQRFLNSFQALVKQDTSGEFVRGVVDQIGILDDFDNVLDILEETLEANPNRFDLRINLAVTYLASEDYDMAIEELEQAQAITDDPLIQMDITRLLLSANNPDFEGRMAEIEAQVNGGATIGTADIRFLEDIIHQAPTLIEAYILLGKAFFEREEPAEALEILMDGYAEHPEDSELLLQIGRVLWQTGNEAEAMNYLNQGIEANPNYVPLLALIGQYLFENRQEEAARACLARAEVISPRDPALAKARKNIADIIASRD